MENIKQSELKIEQIIDLMDLYVSQDHSHRNLHHPFIEEDYIIATDGYGMVVLDEDLYENENVKVRDSPLDALRLIRKEHNCDIILKASDLESDKKDTIEECEECDGEGTVEFEYASKEKIHYKDFKCPICDGEGQIGVEHQIKIVGRYMWLSEANRLLKAMSILEVDSAKIVYMPKKDLVCVVMIGDISFGFVTYETEVGK